LKPSAKSKSILNNEKAHIDCSESFYKDCIVQDIQSQPFVEQEDKKKMMDILARFEAEVQEGLIEAEDEELSQLGVRKGVPELLERLGGLDLGEIFTC
jgi:hypothetical protein